MFSSRILYTAAFLSLLSFSFLLLKTPESHDSFISVINFGSSGSRIYIYSYQKRKDLLVPRLHELPPTLASHLKPISTKSAYNRIETRPGVAEAFANGKNVTEQLLKPLIVWARAVIPTEVLSQTPIIALATAGVRKLPLEDQNNLLKEIRATLSQSGFKFEPGWARTIDGEEEGLFGWVALNYRQGVWNTSEEKCYNENDLRWKTSRKSAWYRREKLPLINHKKERLTTIAALDMGGSSMQFTTELPALEDMKGEKVVLGTYGVTNSSIRGDNSKETEHHWKVDVDAQNNAKTYEAWMENKMDENLPPYAVKKTSEAAQGYITPKSNRSYNRVIPMGHIVQIGYGSHFSSENPRGRYDLNTEGTVLKEGDDPAFEGPLLKAGAVLKLNVRDKHGLNTIPANVYRVATLSFEHFGLNDFFDRSVAHLLVFDTSSQSNTTSSFSSRPMMGSENMSYLHPVPIKNTWKQGGESLFLIEGEKAGVINKGNKPNWKRKEDGEEQHTITERMNTSQNTALIKNDTIRQQPLHYNDFLHHIVKHPCVQKGFAKQYYLSSRWLPVSMGIGSSIQGEKDVSVRINLEGAFDWVKCLDLVQNVVFKEGEDSASCSSPESDPNSTISRREEREKPKDKNAMEEKESRLEADSFIHKTGHLGVNGGNDQDIAIANPEGSDSADNKVAIENKQEQVKENHVQNKHSSNGCLLGHFLPSDFPLPVKGSVKALSGFFVVARFFNVLSHLPQPISTASKVRLLPSPSPTLPYASRKEIKGKSLFYTASSVFFSSLDKSKTIPRFFNTLLSQAKSSDECNSVRCLASEKTIFKTAKEKTVEGYDKREHSSLERKEEMPNNNMWYAPHGSKKVNDALFKKNNDTTVILKDSKLKSKIRGTSDLFNENEYNINQSGSFGNNATDIVLKKSSMDSFHLNEDFSNNVVEQLLLAVRRDCSVPWEKVSIGLLEEPNAEKYCTWGPYVVLLLNTVFGNGVTQISFGTGDLGWETGAALLTVLQQPMSDKELVGVTSKANSINSNTFSKNNYIFGDTIYLNRKHHHRWGLLGSCTNSSPTASHWLCRVRWFTFWALGVGLLLVPFVLALLAFWSSRTCLTFVKRCCDLISPTSRIAIEPTLPLYGSSSLSTSYQLNTLQTERIKRF
mmetsp:Transcript_11204/g.20289  ORF Transcript_11204/g.20289 Transcript_11204/m.20289 type:complete len:1143 (-) Transcript_11204:194-3622(-)